jgi:hypothetical protein
MSLLPVVQQTKKNSGNEPSSSASSAMKSGLINVHSKRKSGMSKLIIINKIRMAGTQKLRENHSYVWDDRTGDLDKMGLVMMVTVIFLCIIFPMVALSAFISLAYILPMGFLPWEILSKEMSDESYSASDKSNFSRSQIVLYVLHAIFGIPLVLETLRALPLLIIWLVIPVQLSLLIIKLLEELQVVSKNRRQIKELFSQYDQFRINNNASMPHTALEVGFLFFSGAVLSIVANFAAIRTYRIFPWYIYLVCPSTAVVVLLIIQLLLPYGINVHTLSTSMLRKWTLEMSPGNPFIRRKLKSLRSIRWYAGFFDYNFFLIQNSVKMGYYAVILGYTIDLVMLIPESALLNVI